MIERAFIGVVTCEKRREYADMQRQTWVKDCGCEVKFFLARQAREALPEENFIGKRLSCLSREKKLYFAATVFHPSLPLHVRVLAPLFARHNPDKRSLDHAFSFGGSLPY